jgi:hypothetical protein
MEVASYDFCESSGAQFWNWFEIGFEYSVGYRQRRIRKEQLHFAGNGGAIESVGASKFITVGRCENIGHVA